MQKICAVYGQGAVTDGTYQKWFAKLRARDFLLDNSPWSGRPVEVGSDQIEILRTINIIPQWETANTLKISKSIVTDKNEKCLFFFTETNFLPTQYKEHISLNTKKQTNKKTKINSIKK